MERTFLSLVAIAAVVTLLGYPYGSLIVKVNYTSDRKTARLTVMYKVKGYDPQNGDWFWAAYAPDGTVEGEGKMQSCIGCHSVRADHDHVFLRSLK